MNYLIVGLGNPEPEYAGTRHNLGRWVGKKIAAGFATPDLRFDAKAQALKAAGELGGKKVSVVLPDNYMNNSGPSLKSFVKTAKEAEKVIVIYDDLDLPLGTMKVSFDKSSGGHRGLESIIKTLKTTKFVRLRLGICPLTPTGKPKKPVGEEKVVAFLMARPKEAELAILKKVTARAAEALGMIVAEGWPKAASLYNN